MTFNMLKSKAFWGLVVETVTTLIAFMGSNAVYSPEVDLWVKMAWGLAQPFIIMFVAQYATEDFTMWKMMAQRKFGLLK